MESDTFNPHALFGIHGLDKWSHTLFWGLLVNVGLYVLLSLLRSQSSEEEQKALLVVESYVPEKVLPAQSSVGEIEGILSQFVGRRESREIIDRTLQRQGLEGKDVSSKDLIGLQEESQRVLSGILGSSIASMVFEDRLTYTDQERVELLSTIKEMNKTLRLSRRELASANRQLAVLKEFSENIIESLPLGVATFDRDMRVRYWNREMAVISGVEKSAALGGIAAEVLSCLPPGVMSPAVRVGDFKCATSEAQLKGYISRLTGASPGYVIVLEDVTERRKIEEELFQATKHASVGRLAAGVSHEIGNPLASISSLVQELMSEKQSDFSRDSLETIIQHLNRIARIVRNLGDFARINPRQKVPSDLGKILESTLALVRYDTNFRKVRITTEVGDLPAVKVDPDQMQQVFLNLILNSRDAMPKGGELIITMEAKGEEVLVVFGDSGEGVPPDIRDKIFDPFFTTKKGPVRGTGLGLGISYGIIKDHGGTIEVVPGGGRGASFAIRLPLSATVDAL
jgi:nitrogen fixation/metabolism regulation signal transduction histidine kinase